MSQSTVQETLTINPYYVPNKAIHVSGCFVCTTRPRVDRNGSRAEFSLPPQRRHDAFARFVIPAVLLDGLARLPALTSQRYAPISAPVSIGRIDFYDDRNDVALADTYPDGITLYRCGAIEPENTTEVDTAEAKALGAFGPDGRLLLTMTGLQTVVLGYLDTHSGQFLTPKRKARLTREYPGCGG